MKNIITAQQTREADRYTIQTEPIASIDLMERASEAFVSAFVPLYPDKGTPILVCCGTGNNGGDGLAIARLLLGHGYEAITVWIARFTDRESDDFAANLARLHHKAIPITEFLPADRLPPIPQCIVIDALLGSGLNKALQGDWLRLVQHINQSQRHVVAVDVPTGLPTDGIIPESEECLYAQDVISFQRPKLSFFFPESARAMARFQVMDIGLDEAFIESMPCDFKLIEREDIQRIYRRRKPFSHKGTYGHALIIAGSQHTMGAALLSSGACVHTGAGLTTACIPQAGLIALNASHPEVMYCPWEELADKWSGFDAVGIGPGLGNTVEGLPVLLQFPAKPLVLDADALTFLAQNTSLVSRLPKHTVLTPHMKEFDRLFGDHGSWWHRIQTARQKAAEFQLIIALKNQYTFIVLPTGEVLANPTGNPAMASGGMGDVLTGMLTAFLAQGYPPEEAAILACYLHGDAGDRMASAGMAVIPANTLLRTLPDIIGKI